MGSAGSLSCSGGPTSRVQQKVLKISHLVFTAICRERAKIGHQAVRGLHWRGEVRQRDQATPTTRGQGKGRARQAPQKDGSNDMPRGLSKHRLHGATITGRAANSTLAAPLKI